MRIILCLLALSCLMILSGCFTNQQLYKKQSSLQVDTLIIAKIFPFQLQHCHGSSIVELPNEDLLVAWFQGSGERTADDVAINGSRYNHKTHRWSKPFVLADVPEFPDINPVLFIDGRSRLWLVCTQLWPTSGKLLY